MDNMAPDTTLALLQTTQADAAKAAGKVKNIKSSIDIEKVEAAAKEFEAVFIAEMMKHAHLRHRDSIEPSSQ